MLFLSNCSKWLKTSNSKKVNNAFQGKLNRDIKKINASNKVFTFADKSRNLYQLEKHNYEKLLTENITSNYKLAPENSANAIADHLETMNKRNAFITLKDHKENFQNIPRCRLVNPTNSNLGIVRKNILENINNTVRSLTNARQWRNTEAVNWFRNLKNKKCLSFVVFDIVDFYASITPNLLRRAIDYAKQFVSISDEDFNIIMQSRSLFFNDGRAWCKSNNDDLFDVTMGSFDGAQICELVGLLILDKLKNTFISNDIG